MNCRDIDKLGGHNSALAETGVTITTEYDVTATSVRCSTHY